MQANKRRDTAPEMAVRKLLFASGLRYRVDWALPFDKRRKADIAFTKCKVAVFIDGCFWHGCPDHYSPPNAHADYWSDKLAGNRKRDQQTVQMLNADGWRVLRFWEHQTPESVAAAIEREVRSGAMAAVSQPVKRRYG